ncbi:MAG: hypothetical protein COW00_16190 [Bdellovibrio sp. CG12_big_fil_rev_8_21_14_0_65_39_13]|nr:MAG: hypothetical protein COW78_02570 [Bdellovibrio sp. CG22_combo_CG10-13_8_21_14_all_39_27]PIQ58382.1 MAG: hypothetical protein COW00_16190 [Bdellovibrio sp. CG12_big_fil_rev_8_21_14_0_65_39_13]PIR35895.1 MAG: hypothetical protein COV37_06775 [Bdellovibrio sp. CG11_big_fil_rev_8_21_14_0_20_39_38]PJB53687.1 MAG: hypothetical protein CO099_05770 [Bdellovibrio sp. CG_4_9_14_3_um_filter_39_7]
MKILVTGCTGFLGPELLEHFKLQTHHHFYLVTRQPEKNYISLAIKDFPHIELVSGDITRPDVLIDSELMNKLIDEVEIILHAAAYYDLAGSYSSCFMYNVVGTQNMIFLAKRMKKLKYFHYVSTVAVAGDYSETMPEKFLELGQKYSNHYAKTKADAEKMVREAIAYLPQIRIYRLGILIGNSVDGEMAKLDGPYYFTHAISQLLQDMPLIKRLPVLIMPFHANSLLPIIPVDYAAKFITHAMEHPSEDEKCVTYHVISDQCPNLEGLLQDILQAFGLKMKVIGFPRHQMIGPVFKAMKLPPELIDYMYATTTYDIRNRNQDYSDIPLGRYHDYKEAFIKGALEREKSLEAK